MQAKQSQLFTPLRRQYFKNIHEISYNRCTVIISFFLQLIILNHDTHRLICNLRAHHAVTFRATWNWDDKVSGKFRVSIDGASETTYNTSLEKSEVICYIFLIIKPTRCTNFSNLFLEWKSTCFGQFLCPSPGVFHCKHSNGLCHTGLLTACRQDQDGTPVPSWSCSQAVSKPVWHIYHFCVYSEKLLMMDRGTVRNV